MVCDGVDGVDADEVEAAAVTDEDLLANLASRAKKRCSSLREFCERSGGIMVEVVGVLCEGQKMKSKTATHSPCRREIAKVDQAVSRQTGLAIRVD